MIKLSHYFNFICQRLFPLVALVLLLLRKSLHCHQLIIAKPLREVDSCERPFPDLLLRLEQFMEVSLVYSFLEL